MAQPRQEYALLSMDHRFSLNTSVAVEWVLNAQLVDAVGILNAQGCLRWLDPDIAKETFRGHRWLSCSWGWASSCSLPPSLHIRGLGFTQQSCPAQHHESIETSIQNGGEHWGLRVLSSYGGPRAIPGPKTIFVCSGLSGNPSVNSSPGSRLMNCCVSFSLCDNQGA